MGAKLRIVRRRIRSVQSTMKITRAMELIAASRIVKAQQRVEAAGPSAELLTRAMEDVARQTGALVHPLLEERETAERVGGLVVTSDRGLAGSYNANVLRPARALRPASTPGAARRRFLPAPRHELGDVKGRPHPEYIFEPAPAAILDELLPQYVITKVYAALLESAASENAARRRAVKAGTDHAGG